MVNPFEEETPKTKKRPDLLTILCILTFIGSGLGFFVNFFIAITYDTLTEMIENGEFPSRYQFAVENMTWLLSAGINYFVISFVLFAASFTGAMFMWNLKRTGFHIYAIAQILILILPAFFMNGQGISIYNFFFTGLFIGLYAINLKAMQ